MKLKKLLIALMMVTVVAVAGVLTACGETLEPITDKTEAHALLLAAADKQNIESSFTTDITMTMTEEGQTYTMGMKILYNNKEFTAETTMTMVGFNMTALSYYKDGYLYTSAMGTKTKMAYDIDAAMEEAMSGGNINADMLDEFMGDEWTFEGKVENNQHVFTFTGEEGSFLVKVDKDGYMTYGKSVFEGGEMEMTYKYVETTLEFPTDLGTYTEVDSDMDTDEIFG